MEEFELKEEHLKLLKEANWDYSSAEFGAPMMDPKKPYGRSFPIHHMCEILGIDFPDEDALLDKPGEYDHQYDLLVKRLTPIHYGLVNALRIIFSTGSMEPGLYRKKRKYCSEWELIETRENKLKRLALEAANALWALAEGKDPERDPKSINQDIYRMFGTGGHYPYPEVDD